MGKIRQLLVAFLLSMVAACGGGGTIGDSGTPATPTTTIELAIKNNAGIAAVRVSRGTPLTVTATVKTNGVAVASKLVSFSLNDAELASFNNGAATAQTDAQGNAVIGLLVGTKSGAGIITATLPSGEKKEITFESAGDSVVADVVTISLALEKNATAVDSVLTYLQPMVIVATLNSSTGVSQAGKIVSFSLSNAALAKFGNDTATALTDASGKARLPLTVGTVKGDGLLNASIPSGEKASIAFSAAGDLPNGDFKLSSRLLTSAGADSIMLSKSSPLTLVANLEPLKQGSSVANQLLTFSLSNTSLAAFADNQLTALTNKDGVVSVQLQVGAVKGSGTLTVVGPGNVRSDINFSSAGDSQVTDEITVTLQTKNKDGVTSQLSRDLPLTVEATVVSKLNGPLAGQLVNFSLNDAALAVFGNAAGTAETNNLGVAAIQLKAGAKSGAGALTATLASQPTVKTNKTFVSAGDGGVIDTTPVGDIKLYADKLALGSGKTDRIELSALVRDKNNILMKNVKVQFSVNNQGSLRVESDQTGVDGVAKAYLSSSNDFSLRELVVTAAAGSENKTAQLAIQVTGTGIDGIVPTAVVLNSTAELIFTLIDADGKGIAGVPLTLTSSLGNQFSNAAPVTDVTSGAVKVNYTAVKSDTAGDLVTVSALGVTKSFRIAISPDVFNFTETTPLVLEIPLNTPQLLSVLWQTAGVPKDAGAVQFASSRGAVATSIAGLTANNSVANTQTASNGQASVYLQAQYAGLATLKAVANTISAQRIVEFVATTPSASKGIEVQALPAQISAGEKSTIQAVLRDALNNPIKNKTVVFSLVNGAGGSLSPVTAITNSQGVATTTFTADVVTPGSGTPATSTGIAIKAALVNDENIKGTGNVAVGRKTLFFRFGTGNTLEKREQTIYAQQFAIIVTDASGNPVPNQLLNVAVFPKKYSKGFWVKTPIGQTFKSWKPIRSTESAGDCGSEDVNRNGVLDAGEDTNSDGVLTPGNIASVQQTVTANQDGIAFFNLVYPRDYAGWLDVDITVSGQAAGTENISTRTFGLAALGEDTNKEDLEPPANPFGRGRMDPVTQLPSQSFCTFE
jgi:hypothetical protein